MYVEHAADEEMCIYCVEVNTYFSFLFFLYFCQFISLYKCGIKGKLGTFATQ